MNSDALVGLSFVGLVILGAGAFCAMVGADAYKEEQARRWRLARNALFAIGLVHMAPGIFSLWMRALLG